MENELLGIGRVAALSGLPVSALRFYDGAGVLPPAMVDPASGYRFYLPSQVATARLVAHLRRVGPAARRHQDRAGRTGAGRVDPGHPPRPAGSRPGRRPQGDLHRPSPARARGDHHDPLHPARRRTDPGPRARCGTRSATTRTRRAERGLPRQRARPAAAWSPPTGTDSPPPRWPRRDDCDIHVLLPTAAVDELLAADPVGAVDIAVADGTITVSGDSGHRPGARCPTSTSRPTAAGSTSVAGRSPSTRPRCGPRSTTATTES